MSIVNRLAIRRLAQASAVLLLLLFGLVYAQEKPAETKATSGSAVASLAAVPSADLLLEQCRLDLLDRAQIAERNEKSLTASLIAAQKTIAELIDAQSQKDRDELATKRNDLYKRIIVSLGGDPANGDRYDVTAHKLIKAKAKETP